MIDIWKYIQELKFSILNALNPQIKGFFKIPAVFIFTLLPSNIVLSLRKN